MKLTADQNGNSRRFSAKLGWKEQFDPKEIEILSARAIPSLIPPVSVQGRRNNIIQYDISEYSTLEFYLSCILSREQFADLILQCIDVFQRMQQIYLNYKNIVFDVDKIYIRLGDRTVHFIYLPLMNSKREASIPDFFRLLMVKAVRSTYEQSAFIEACLAWLNRPTSFVLSEFESFIKSTVYVCASANQSTPENSHAYVQPSAPERFVPPVSAQPSQGVDFGAFQSATCQLETSFGETVLLSENKPVIPAISFYIVRAQNDERILLDHSPFLVGTEVGAVAYCVTGNAAVSRRHAEFSCKDGEWMITDQKSTNKTYVNDSALVPLAPHILKDGDSIRLGNEQFLFVREEQC